MKVFGMMFLLALEVSTQEQLIGERIGGGHLVDILDFPYQVSFQINESHACGGSIISSRFVLTAAHCTYRLRKLPSGMYDDMWVRAGSSDWTKGGVRIGVKNHYQHPLYSSTNKYCDVSVLELESDLPFGPAIQKVNLVPLGQAVPFGARVKIAGWGQTETNKMVDLLRGVEITVVDQQSCADMYVNFTDINQYRLCAGVENGGLNSCKGDSGGALVTADGTQIGITAFGLQPCFTTIPAVYINVANDEIREFISEKSGV